MLYILKSGFNIYNVYILYTYDISQSVGSIYTMLGYIIYLKVWVQYIYICNAWIYCVGYDMKHGTNRYGKQNGTVAAISFVFQGKTIRGIPSPWRANEAPAVRMGLPYVVKGFKKVQAGSASV